MTEGWVGFKSPTRHVEALGRPWEAITTPRPGAAVEGSGASLALGEQEPGGGTWALPEHRGWREVIPDLSFNFLISIVQTHRKSARREPGDSAIAIKVWGVGRRI